MKIILYDDEPYAESILGTIEVLDDFNIEQEMAEWREWLKKHPQEWYKYAREFSFWLMSKYPNGRVTTIYAKDWDISIYTEKHGLAEYKNIAHN